jgi:hypothetical protein
MTSSSAPIGRLTHANVVSRSLVYWSLLPKNGRLIFNIHFSLATDGGISGQEMP